MARKTSFSSENLVALGAVKLAELILDEALSNAPYRKKINAVLAGAKGAEAIAALIDRRLAGLEKARAMIDWDKEKAFCADLAATVAAIVKELGAADPALALKRLIRFLDTHPKTFDRIDDSSGRIQAVYWNAAEQAPFLAEKLAPDDRATLTAALTKSLRLDSHGLGQKLAANLIPLLPAPTLAAWDLDLADAGGDDRWIATRQAIAAMRGDLDLFLALEAKRPAWRQNPLQAAEKLLAAGRLDDALVWARKKHRAGREDLQNGAQGELEARILDAKGERVAAQNLRWARFAATLDPDALRDYLRKLDDFEEDDALDRAFARAEESPQIHQALAFFLVWPSIERAAKLVLRHAAQWDGRQYELLGAAAPALKGKFPLAASALYRALLTDILSRANSAAYGHGARYLARLDLLARQIDDWKNLDAHIAFTLRLQTEHGRKRGFWSLVAARPNA